MRERNKYIGSTDVAAIVGLCRYRNPLQVFNSKIGAETQTQNNAMKMGLRLEPIVIKMAEEELGVKVKQTQVQTFHETYDFLGGTADAICEDGTLLEVKTSAFGKDFDQENVPDSYMIQVQWLLMLNKLNKAYLVVLIGAGFNLKTYTIYYDPNLCKKLVNACVSFWQKHVLTGIPPTVEPKINKELPTETFSLYQKITDLQSKISEQNKLLDELKEQFNAVTPNQTEIINNGRLLAKRTISWRETIDKKALAEDMPIDKYIKRTQVTTLRFY